MSDTAYINEVGIKEGDIIFVKFKPLNDIIAFFQEEGHSAVDFLQNSYIDNHLTAIIEGGYFRVEDVYSDDRSKSFPQTKALRRASDKQKPHEIGIDNHFANDQDWFKFNENIVEEIRVEHDAQESYFSSKFNISLLKIDGALYINNERVKKSDGKLLDILESTISDLAIQRMLADSKEDDNNN